jgi:hypothetical protein
MFVQPSEQHTGNRPERKILPPIAAKDDPFGNGHFAQKRSFSPDLFYVRFAPETVIRPRYRFGCPPRLAPNARDGLNGDLPTLTRLSRFAGLV